MQVLPLLPPLGPLSESVLFGPMVCLKKNRAMPLLGMGCHLLFLKTIAPTRILIGDNNSGGKIGLSGINAFLDAVAFAGFLFNGEK
jgi:hypothetical protein